MESIGNRQMCSLRGMWRGIGL